jgi:hypothetical protein
MKTRYVLPLILLVAAYPCGAFSYDSLPELGEPIPIEIDIKDVVDELIQGNIEYAMQLAKDYALQRIHQELTNEKNIAKAVVFVAKKLQTIVNDDSLSEEEKGKHILDLIERSMGPHESQKYGALDLQFKHSAEYGVTRLEWDSNVVVDECDGGGLFLTCYGTGECVWEWRYWTDYVLRVPDVYIYRDVGGREVLLTKIEGYKRVSEGSSISITENPWESLKDLYDYLQDDFDVGISEGRSVFYDHNSDYRRAGETLSYRVRVDNGPYQGVHCGTDIDRTSIGHVDSDGDGKAEFLPESVYGELFGKHFGWLVPTTSVLMQ